MKPRDWVWNHLKERIVLLNCLLPERFDNRHDYRHAHRMWIREGKWSADQGRHVFNYVSFGRKYIKAQNFAILKRWEM